jgi:hypothetical protein
MIRKVVALTLLDWFLRDNGLMVAFCSSGDRLEALDCNILPSGLETRPDQSSSKFVMCFISKETPEEITINFRWSLI